MFVFQILLILSAVFYFAGDSDNVSVRTFGAIGIAVKWLQLLDLMRTNSKMSAFVRVQVAKHNRE